MPRPTKEQLKRINKFTQTALEEDQVYVFRSLSADTLPVQRYGWFGEYSINMNSRTLNDLKKDSRVGVGLLASHNSYRLPFGRTFDAEVTVDHVSNESVETLYVDHYIVTHMQDEEGNKVPLMTEIGMTTQDIANHIDAGHTFDTSIGFSITEPQCTICKHDIRDHEKCSHIPGIKYDVQSGDEVVKMRCDILANGASLYEQSLVYAGAVNRALIQNGQNNEFSAGSATTNQSLQAGVNSTEVTLYNVDDIKTIPLNTEIYCRMSKGNMEMFTFTSDRKIFKKSEGSETMATTETGAVLLQGEGLLTAPTVAQELYDAKVAEVQELSTKLGKSEEKVTEFEAKIADLETKLATADAEIVSLTAKSELADKFTKNLIEETVKAGVQARGNGFNAERYQKYAETLSVDELKEELNAFRSEFPGTVEEARVTATELQENNKETVTLSKTEQRQLAAEKAMERYKREGGNLEALTKEEFAKLAN